MRVESLTLTLILTAIPALSGAELIEADLQVPGDGLVTRDTQTGLEWLDLDQTFRRSYNDVAADASLSALGFRHANTSEVEGLFAAGNVLSNPSVAAATAFIELLSEVASFFPGTNIVSLSNGLHDRDPIDANWISYAGVLVTEDPATGVRSGGNNFNNENAVPFNTKDFVPSFSGNYLVRPAAAEDLLTDLVSTVLGLNLNAGIGNSLDRKLQNALAALDRAQSGDSPAAMGIMYAFIQSVEAQRGKRLTEAQTDELVGAAQAIISALEGAT